MFGKDMASLVKFTRASQLDQWNVIKEDREKIDSLTEKMEQLTNDMTPTKVQISKWTSQFVLNTKSDLTK